MVRGELVAEEERLVLVNGIGVVLQGQLDVAENVSEDSLADEDVGELLRIVRAQQAERLVEVKEGIVAGLELGVEPALPVVDLGPANRLACEVVETEGIVVAAEETLIFIVGF